MSIWKTRYYAKGRTKCISWYDASNSLHIQLAHIECIHVDMRYAELCIAYTVNRYIWLPKRRSVLNETKCNEKRTQHGAILIQSDTLIEANATLAPDPAHKLYK